MSAIDLLVPISIAPLYSSLTVATAATRARPFSSRSRVIWWACAPSRPHRR